MGLCPKNLTRPQPYLYFLCYFWPLSAGSFEHDAVCFASFRPKIFSFLPNEILECSKNKAELFGHSGGDLPILSCVGRRRCYFEKYGGRAGLGMHFQNPYFLSLMVVMLSLFTANLWVFFEVTLPLKITWAVNIVLNRQHGGRAPSLLEGEKVMALCCVRGCWRFC